jgi:hypothetical protein
MNSIYPTLQAQQGDFGELGSWFKRTVSNVGKFVQQTDLVSHAANEIGVGKSTVGKILVPTASNNVNKYQTIVKSEQTKPTLKTVDAINCVKSQFAKDPRCVEFMKTQQTVQTSQNIISAKEDIASTKTKLIVGGSIAVALALLAMAGSK